MLMGKVLRYPGPIQHIGFATKSGYVSVGGVLVNFFGSTHVNQLPLLQNRQALGQTQGVGSMVGYKDAGRLGFGYYVANGFGQAAVVGQIQVGKRLVEQQHLGFFGQGSGNSGALFFSTRKEFGGLFGEGFQLAQSQKFFNAGISVGFFVVPQSISDIFAHGKRWRKVVILVHNLDVGVPGDEQITGQFELYPLQPNLASIRIDQVGRQLEQSTLASATCAQKAKNFTCL